ncbi:LTA synthase family protein [Propionicimonas paludicola]|uniref:LTA synthase family protein n=1 Tax=Propionicimonas paludicola TaxID=185243 RepID=UPI001476433B|nr:LTA synthase family protein [Propionicimonas paludicola]
MRWVLIVSTLAFAVTGIWVRYRFGAVLLDQALLNLPGGASEAGAGAVAVELAAWLIAPLALVLVIAIIVIRRGRRGGRVRGRVTFGPIWLPLLAAVVSFAGFASITGVPQYLYSLTDGRSIEPYYVTPSVTAGPARPLNLITIYLESIENAFGDSALFGEDLLSEVKAATADWSSYPRLEQPASSGWTMAGIVATQCGLALKSDLFQAGFDPNETGERVDSYLPGAVCLGDVLRDAGYTSTFAGGATTEFAGKGKYLSAHGYQTVLGLDDWVRQGEPAQDISSWGLSDERLFDRAAAIVDDLHARQQPFNLTLLTLDTHEPATVHGSCNAGQGASMAVATKCSMRAVAGFLKHLRAAGYLKDTVVVVTGDHLKAVGDGTAFHQELSHAGQRSIFFRLWSPRPVHLGVDRGDQFSVLPTTLEALGFSIPDGRAGLGLSLLGTRAVRGVALSLPSDTYRALLAAPSRDFYARIWAR